MKRFVEEAGMILLEAKDADTEGEPTDKSERIHMVVKEQGK